MKLILDWALLRTSEQRYLQLIARDVAARDAVVWSRNSDAALSLRENDLHVTELGADFNLSQTNVKGVFDLAVCTKVLEYCREGDVDKSIAGLKPFSSSIVFVISTTFSDEPLVDGENAHWTIRDPAWWRHRLLQHFPLVKTIPGMPEGVVVYVTWCPRPELNRILTQKNKSRKFADKVCSALAGPRNHLRKMFGAFLAEGYLLEALQGKSVALVGNATSLKESEHGREIEAADIVIRFNRAPILNVRSHGIRTDWIATGLALNPEMVAYRKVSVVLWMTKLRKMPSWMYGHGRVYLHPRTSEAALEQKIGKRPSTGFMVIDLLARSKCKSVMLYGFDFFSSLSVSGYRTAAEVPHDFEKERELVEDLLRTDPRFMLKR